MTYGADDASWHRIVRWARQVAARHEDPLPLARTLGLHAQRVGRADVTRQLDRALAIARDICATTNPEAYAAVEREVRRLEVSYG